VRKLNLTGQTHTTIATTRTQNANHSLRVCWLTFTKELSVPLPERIKTNKGFAYSTVHLLPSGHGYAKAKITGQCVFTFGIVNRSMQCGSETWFIILQPDFLTLKPASWGVSGSARVIGTST
jgi:hypothetical protein